MPSLTTHGRIAALVLILVGLSGLAPVSQAAWVPDSGTPDSLWIPSVPWRGDTLFAVDVYAATDDSLLVAQIALAWTNPALRVDSVRFDTGRWNVTGYNSWTVGADSQSVALGYLPTQKRLPPGSGPVAKIYFGRDSAYTFDSDILLDTAWISNTPPLAPYQTLFTSGPDTPFLPAFISTAVISFSPCICINHGDLYVDGIVDAVDLAHLIDGVFFGGSLPAKDPQCPHIHAGDYNCDDSYDAVDLAYMIDYLFFGGVSACNPCTDR